ncbi:MAG: hypothetical protein OJF47_001801 [Nitrospira sp.]|nr:MAG: hypothetical protein OJF47_001801 [Nitrospira sp.]
MRLSSRFLDDIVLQRQELRPNAQERWLIEPETFFSLLSSSRKTE